jgi:hypothetical protein
MLRQLQHLYTLWSEANARRRERQLLCVPDRFPITGALAAQIRAGWKGKQPTEEQWRAILSPAQNTLVVAGAGSGKSTALVGRVVVLHCYLKVPLEHITVFSFTRRSTAEFRDRLHDALAERGVCVSRRTVERRVRTFHSKVLEFRPERSVWCSPS